MTKRYPADQPWTRETGNGFRETAIALLMAVGLSIPVAAPGALLMRAEHTERQAALRAVMERQASHTRLMAAPPQELLAVGPAAHGRDLFESACAACHKQDGTGMVGLGKDLTRSGFVASLGDDDLLRFVINGRTINDPYNTTRVPMPPRGGHDELTDNDLSDIVAYVRGLQDPRRLPTLPLSAMAAAAAAPSTADEKAKALAAAGGDAELAEFIAHGTKLYAGTCSACHGKDARGLAGLGKDLVNSSFCKSLDDDSLLAFIKKGRDPSDPANTTKVGMPARGGNPALSDDDLLDVIAYVRTLQRQPATP